jgi:hypothetical protein
MAGRGADARDRRSLSTGSIDRDARIPKPSMFRLAWYAVVPESSGRSGFYG